MVPWNALAGGCSILVLVASRRVAGPRVLRTLMVGTSGGAEVEPGVPRPALPSLLTIGTCNNNVG